jgi:hypothetical protein
MHMGSITVTGRLANLAEDLLADLRLTIVIMPSKKKLSP